MNHRRRIETVEGYLIEFCSVRMALLDVTKSCLDSISQVNLISILCKPLISSNVGVVDAVSGSPNSCLSVCFESLHFSFYTMGEFIFIFMY